MNGGGHPPLFVSYSHKNSDWLDKIKNYFGVFEDEGEMGYWSDQSLKPGDEWESEIKRAIDNALIAILLVTPELLQSTYVMEKEMRRFVEILDGTRQGRLRKILPLILEPCDWESEPEIAKLDVRPKRVRSLSDLRDTKERRGEMLAFVNEINAILDETPGLSFEETFSTTTPGTSCATLELQLSHCERQNYRVDLTLTVHGELDNNLPRHYVVPLDPKSLSEERDALAYAKKIRKALFPVHNKLDIFGMILDKLSKSGSISIRIYIEPSALELRSLRWETLLLSETRLENADFARYLIGSGLSVSPAYIRCRESRYRGVLIGVDLDVARSSSDVVGLPQLASVGEIFMDKRVGIDTKVNDGWCSVDALGKVLELYDGYDFVYLLIKECHYEAGTTVPCEIVLDNSSPGDRVRHAIASAMRRMEHPPRMVVIAPAEEPRTDCWEWFLYLADEIVAGGALGVLTLQGALAINIWHTYLRCYLKTLSEDGRIDRAATMARLEIDDPMERWKPVNVVRLRSARVWYQPRFMDNSRAKSYWGDLIEQIEEGRCIPVIGAGIDYRIARFRQRIAREWAERHQYPLGHREALKLSQVAQYVALTQTSSSLVREYKEDLLKHIEDRYGKFLQNLAADATLDDKLSTILLNTPSEPHSILAALPFSAYVTANYSNLVAAALRAESREPIEALFRDKNPRASSSGAYTVQSPLVYHLFGSIEDIDTLVLTEDDYFEFLIDFWRHRSTMPKALIQGLTSASILFLGFHLNDWDFRVIFRSLTKLEGWSNTKSRINFAVQVDPDDDFITDADRARDYLAKYFQEMPSQVSIYWGSSESFLRELKEHWDRTHP